MARRARLGESHLSRQLCDEAAASLKQTDQPVSGRLAETGELGAKLLGGFEHCMYVHTMPGSLTATPWLC